MTKSTRLARTIMAFAFAFAALPAATAAAEATPPAAEPRRNAAGPLACKYYPITGEVAFYQHTNCGGEFQSMARCGPHRFTRHLFRQASSYIDKQTDGAYAIVYEGQSTVAFTTIPNTGLRNVAVWENDRSEWASIIC